MRKDIKDLRKVIREINMLNRELGYTQSEKRIRDLNIGLAHRYAYLEALWSRIMRRILKGESLDAALQH